MLPDPSTPSLNMQVFFALHEKFSSLKKMICSRPCNWERCSMAWIKPWPLEIGTKTSRWDGPNGGWFTATGLSVAKLVTMQVEDLTSCPPGPPWDSDPGSNSYCDAVYFLLGSNMCQLACRWGKYCSSLPWWALRKEIHGCAILSIALIG